jgi:hypothetical protein
MDFLDNVFSWSPLQFLCALEMCWQHSSPIARCIAAFGLCEAMATYGGGSISRRVEVSSLGVSTLLYPASQVAIRNYSSAIIPVHPSLEVSNLGVTAYSTSPAAAAQISVFSLITQIYCTSLY